MTEAAPCVCVITDTRVWFQVIRTHALIDLFHGGQPLRETAVLTRCLMTRAKHSLRLSGTFKEFYFVSITFRNNTRSDGLVKTRGFQKIEHVRAQVPALRHSALARRRRRRRQQVPAGKVGEGTGRVLWGTHHILTFSDLRSDEPHPGPRRSRALAPALGSRTEGGRTEHAATHRFIYRVTQESLSLLLLARLRGRPGPIRRGSRGVEAVGPCGLSNKAGGLTQLPLWHRGPP